MYRTIIIDDEPLACSLLSEYLSDRPEFEIVAVCHNGFDGVKAIQELNPDLVFLDVQMPKLNGFEMLELLEETPSVIFATAFDEFAIKAFDENAIDYLLKPFSRERFDHSLEKFIRRLPGKLPDQEVLENLTIKYPMAERVAIKNGNKIHVLPYHSIYLIEADDDYVVVRTDQGAFAKKRTLGYFEKSLPANSFVRVHRSFLVNIQHINRMEQTETHRHELILRNGMKIPVSRSGMQLLKPLIGK